MKPPESRAGARTRPSLKPPRCAALARAVPPPSQQYTRAESRAAAQVHIALASSQPRLRLRGRTVSLHPSGAEERISHSPFTAAALRAAGQTPAPHTLIRTF